MVYKVSYTSGTVAGRLTFTPLLSQGCLDGVVFPEKEARFAPQKERNGNFSTSQDLELFLW